MYIDATLIVQRRCPLCDYHLHFSKNERNSPRFFIWVDQYPRVRLHSGSAYQLHQQLISLPGHLSWHVPLRPYTNNELTHLSSACTCFTDVAYWQFAHVFQRRPRDKFQIPNRGQRRYHSFTGRSHILLHEKLKLAGAARGLAGDHGPSKRTILFLPVELASSTSDVVTNPAVRRGSVHIRILDPKQPVLVDFKLFYFTDKIVLVIVNCFLNALDGWVPPCPFHRVLRIRCKLAAFPKRTIILYFSYTLLLAPKLK